MSELTKEAFEQALTKLATKDDLNRLAKKNDVDTIAVAVAALSTGFAEVREKLSGIQETLDAHSKSLDALLKQTRDWNAEMTVMRNRMDRYEHVLKVLSKKLNLDIDPLLH